MKVCRQYASKQNAREPLYSPEWLEQQLALIKPQPIEGLSIPDTLFVDLKNFLDRVLWRYSNRYNYTYVESLKRSLYEVEVILKGEHHPLVQAESALLQEAIWMELVALIFLPNADQLEGNRPLRHTHNISQFVDQLGWHDLKERAAFLEPYLKRYYRYSDRKEVPVNCLLMQMRASTVQNRDDLLQFLLQKEVLSPLKSTLLALNDHLYRNLSTRVYSSSRNYFNTEHTETNRDQ